MPGSIAVPSGCDQTTRNKSAETSDPTISMAERGEQHSAEARAPLNFLFDGSLSHRCDFELAGPLREALGPRVVTIVKCEIVEVVSVQIFVRHFEFFERFVVRLEDTLFNGFLPFFLHRWRVDFVVLGR